MPVNKMDYAPLFINYWGENLVAHVIGCHCAAEVNAFAVGLPAVFWHQQGFLDLVAGTDYPAIATSASEFEDWNKVFFFAVEQGNYRVT